MKTYVYLRQYIPESVCLEHLVSYWVDYFSKFCPENPRVIETRNNNGYCI